VSTLPYGVKLGGEVSMGSHPWSLFSFTVEAQQPIVVFEIEYSDNCAQTPLEFYFARGSTVADLVNRNNWIKEGLDFRFGAQSEEIIFESQNTNPSPVQIILGAHIYVGSTCTFFISAKSARQPDVLVSKQGELVTSGESRLYTFETTNFESDFSLAIVPFDCPSLPNVYMMNYYDGESIAASYPSAFKFVYRSEDGQSGIKVPSISASKWHVAISASSDNLPCTYSMIVELDGGEVDKPDTGGLNGGDHQSAIDNNNNNGGSADSEEGSSSTTEIVKWAVTGVVLGLLVTTAAVILAVIVVVRLVALRRRRRAFSDELHEHLLHGEEQF